MGCLQSSTANKVENEHNATNAAIEEQLEIDKRRIMNEVKLLLLGAGELADT